MSVLTNAVNEIFEGKVKSISVMVSRTYGFQANVIHSDGSAYCEMHEEAATALFKAIAHVLHRYDRERDLYMATVAEFVSEAEKQAAIEAATERLATAKENLAILFQDKYAASIIELVESILEYRDVNRE